MPDLIIIGGVNGAGKSTIFPAINRVKKTQGSYEPEVVGENNFVNADNIALEKNVNEITAARIALNNINEFIESKESFAVESTLSGKYLINAIKKAKKVGYRIYIFYIILECPELSSVRVTQRALLGKHYIPLSNIIERFNKSFYNFFNSYRPIADFWAIADNSKLLFNPLFWGGNIYSNSKFFTSQMDNFTLIDTILKFNKINFKIDSGDINMNDTFTPEVFRNVQETIELEIRNRPTGNYVCISENFKIKFIKNFR